MAQNVVNYADNPTGPQLLDNYLTKEQENILSSNSGIERPSYAVAGTTWLDTSVTPWLYKIYDGSNDATIGRVNPTTHEFISNIDEIDLVHKRLSETISGIKTFTTSPIVPLPAYSDNSSKTANTAFVKGTITALNTTLVHLTGNESIAGTKTFTTSPVVPTVTTSDNSSKAASTAFVKSLFVQGEPPVDADPDVFYYTLEEGDEE